MVKKALLKFKSDTPNYYKEECGTKSNTLRKFKEPDKRETALNRMIKTRNWGNIEITHKQMPEEFFIRKITDVTKYLNLYIISWG